MAGLNMGSAGIALLGLLAVKGFQNRDQLGKMLGDLTGPNGAAGTAGGNNNGLGGMLGGLGDLLNGGANGSQGNVLNEGLGGLLDRFRQNGQSDAADSWVQSGPNRQIETSQLETALGPDVIEHLEQQTGLSRAELLERLSTNLPHTVDQLTPNGRVPTAEESGNWRF